MLHAPDDGGGLSNDAGPRLESRVLDSPPEAAPDAFYARRRRTTTLVLVAIAAALGLRFAYAAWRPLLPDEAYYWEWSRHLAAGYFDHPPMIAYLIRASTSLLGTSELGVRALGIVLMAGAVGAVMTAAHDLGIDARARLLLLAVWLTSPLWAGLATVMTPDTPAAFFAALALMLAVRVARGLERDEPVGGWHWAGLGVATGAALLSKYTAVLTAGAIGLALLTHPRGRRALRTAGPYVAVALAAAVFLPAVLWNARHDWASFRFQLSHGLAEREDNPLRGLAMFVLGQAAMWTPVLFVLGVAAVGAGWREYRRLGLGERVLVWAATLPLVFFAYAAMRTHGQENWPDLAYFPMSILTARYVSLAWARRAPVARVGCAVALAGALVVQFPEGLRAAGLHVPVALRNLFGWHELGEQLGCVAAASHPDLVYADKMQDAAEVAFYMPGRPVVWHYRRPEHKPSAYEFWDDRPDPRAAGRVLFVGNQWEEFCRDYGFAPVSHGYWVYHHGGRTPDRSRMYSVLERKASAN
jgi:4-amino-4-deoxy-L-arabinose transferase-like glycosyltransferase